MGLQGSRGSTKRFDGSSDDSEGICLDISDSDDLKGKDAHL